MLSRILLLVVFIQFYVNGLDEGDVCNKNGLQGVCRPLQRCPSAVLDLSARDEPEICSIASSGEAVVCCTDNLQAPVTTEKTRRIRSADSKISFEDYDYSSEENECKPIPENQTSKKTGQKAWDKCIEYQEQLVYPCVKSASFLGGMTRARRCNHEADELIVGGKDSKEKEFPHMVLLGFGDSPQELLYKCGGSIISEKFILTAGHCTSDGFYNVSYVAVGRLKRSEPYNSAKVLKVSRVIKHPGYRPPNKHNDIALLELEKPIQLDESTVPACLHVGNKVADNEAIVTGWGLTSDGGKEADTLQKVTIEKFPLESCVKTYKEVRLIKPGFNVDNQLCYGHRNTSNDACQGDSGGPLQIKSRDVHCMYTVIGLTSFGKGCGAVGEPAVYTRVSAHLSWIESYVWPGA